MGLTWSARNEIGVGVGAGDGGLTDLGRSVVQAMADLGMVTDLSHASTTTFWDCIGLQTGNVVATHSNAAALKSHPRNLTDDQLKALGAQGGIVGACALPDFLPGDSPGLSELVDQITYIGGSSASSMSASASISSTIFRKPRRGRGSPSARPAADLTAIRIRTTSRASREFAAPRL